MLHIGNDFQRRRSSAGDEEASSGNGGGNGGGGGGGGGGGVSISSSSRSAGLSVPLFLPLVPSNLRELNLSGAWTSLPARELGVVRRGCRLKKLVITAVRCVALRHRCVSCVLVRVSRVGCTAVAVSLPLSKRDDLRSLRQCRFSWLVPFDSSHSSCMVQRL